MEIKKLFGSLGYMTVTADMHCAKEIRDFVLLHKSADFLTLNANLFKTRSISVHFWHLSFN